MRLWRKGFNLLLLSAIAIALMQSFAPAKIERSKVIKKDFDAKAEIDLIHEHGPLTIKKSLDGRNHMEAEILVTGTNEESIESVMKRLDVRVKESENTLEIATAMGIQNWSKVNDKASIKFCDGEKVKGINDFTVKMTLYIADPKRMRLKNKYDRIDLMEDYKGKLEVFLYSGDLSTANLGSLSADIKYGKAQLKNVDTLVLKLYDAELSAGSVQTVKASSKYSEFTLGDVSGDMTLETYDEKWQVGNVAGQLKLDDKYSEFKFGNIDQVKLRIFDADIKAEKLGRLYIEDSKYTSYKLKEVGKIDIRSVFDDEYDIGEARQVKIEDSKYTEYELDRLGNSFEITQSFDDAISLKSVSAGMTKISIDAKYTELDMEIEDGANFEFTVDQDYGHVKYPEDKLQVSKHLEKNNRITIVGTVGAEAATGQKGTIKINGFDNTLNWH